MRSNDWIVVYSNVTFQFHNYWLKDSNVWWREGGHFHCTPQGQPIFVPMYNPASVSIISLFLSKIESHSRTSNVFILILLRVFICINEEFRSCKYFKYFRYVEFCGIRSVSFANSLPIKSDKPLSSSSSSCTKE